VTCSPRAADPAVIEQTVLPPANAILDQQVCTLYGRPVPAGRPPRRAVA
jgi:hypothetical protein